MAANNWEATLAARARGEVPGFLAHDLPLEEQDAHSGGPRVEVDVPDDAAGLEELGEGDDDGQGDEQGEEAPKARSRSKKA